MNIRILFVFILLTSFSNSFAQLRIKAVGDLMMGSKTPRTVIPADSGHVFVDSIAHYLQEADITFANLEGVFANDTVLPQKCRPESREAKRCYEFGMPDYLAPRLKEMNFDIVSMDNNHVSDYGTEGVLFTRQLLDSLKIAYAGKKAPTTLYRKGKKIALLAFGTSSISYHVANVEIAKQLVAELDSTHDIVIISFHGGAEGSKAQHVYNKTEEFYGENRGNLIAFSHAVIDAGADLVIGHGPHVLRGVELYKNKLICYSLGNFLTHGNVNITGIKGVGVIMDINIDTVTGNFIQAEVISTKQSGYGIPYRDTSNQGFKIIESLSNDDFPESKLLFKDQTILPE